MDARSHKAFAFIIFFALQSFSLPSYSHSIGSHQKFEDDEGESAMQIDETPTIPPSLKSFMIDPTQGQVEQPTGVYWSGRLLHAQSLGNNGAGFVKLFLNRDTTWTSYDSAYIIRAAADMMTHDFPNREPLQIGDLSARNGGQLFQHQSHQTGLDNDIRFFSKNGHLQGSNSTDFDELFVKNGVTTANFDVLRNWHLIHYIVQSGRVGRIFIDPVLKKTFCSYGQTIGMTADVVETLRRLQPLASHQNHFHLRLTCPFASPNCQKQVEVPTGSGC